MEGPVILLTVEFHADNERWTGRRWVISRHMTDSEVVQTCLKAVLTAEEHEAREKFTFMDKPVFGPHINILELLGACDRLDVRQPVTFSELEAQPTL
jgi:hypothetical protein